MTPSDNQTEGQGKVAYERFLNATSWADVAESFGLPNNIASGQRVRGWAERYARRFSLPWPIGYRGRRRMPERYEMGKVCYELRQEGESWQKISAITGITERWCGRVYKVSQVAKTYAEQNGLPWPLAEKKAPKPPRKTWKTEGAKAYDLRSQGKTWQQITDIFGILDPADSSKERLAKISQITHYARVYAEQNGLPWPVGGKRQFPAGAGKKMSSEREAKLKQAYALRQSGLPWRQIAERVGITNARGKGGFLITPLVRQYALKEGLKWPVEIETPAKAQGLVEKVPDLVRDLPPVYVR